MRTHFCLIAAAAALCTLLVPGTAAAQFEPSITASLTEDVVWGGGFGPTAPVTVKVLAADDTVLETVATETDAAGYFQLEPGMQLRATETGSGMVKEMTFAEFSLDRLDPDANVASGTAPANAEVWLNVDEQRFETEADATGAWRVEFPDWYRLSWGSWAEAGTNDFDDDWTGASGQPPAIAVDLGSDRITGASFTLGGDLLVQALADGVPVWWTTVSTETRARCS